MKEPVKGDDERRRAARMHRELILAQRDAPEPASDCLPDARQRPSDAASFRNLLTVAPEVEGPALASAETLVAATSDVQPPPRVATWCFIVTGAIAGGACAHLALSQYFPTTGYRDVQVAQLETQLATLRAELAEKEALWRRINADCCAQIRALEPEAPPSITCERGWVSTDSTISHHPELSSGWGPAAASAGRHVLLATMIATGYFLWCVGAIKTWCRVGHAISLSQVSAFAYGIECWVSWFVRVSRAHLSHFRRLFLPPNIAESCTRVSDEDGAWRRSTYIDPDEVAAVTPSSESTNRALSRWQERRANVGKCGLAGQQRADAALEEASAMKDRVLESILVPNPHLLHARHIAYEFSAAAGKGYHVVQGIVKATSTLTVEVKDMASSGRKVLAPSSAGVSTLERAREARSLSSNASRLMQAVQEEREKLVQAAHSLQGHYSEVCGCVCACYASDIAVLRVYL